MRIVALMVAKDEHHSVLFTMTRWGICPGRALIILARRSMCAIYQEQMTSLGRSYTTTYNADCLKV